MGWLADRLFGKPEEEGGALPKRVQQWNDGDRSTTTTRQTSEHDQPDAQQADVGAPDQEQDPTRDQSGQKIVPEVWVGQLKLRPTSDMKRLEVWAVLENQSEFEVEITSVMLLGSSLDPNRFIKPHASFELLVYNGDTPKDEAYKKLELQYKIVRNGDYFQADHLIQYKLEQEGDKQYFLPEEVTPIRPIRDIWG